MSLKYIRDYYGVPVKRGGVIKFQGDECVIKSADAQYLRVLRLKDNRKLLLHPTWEVEYLEGQHEA
jgi:hypothetical protein